MPRVVRLRGVPARHHGDVADDNEHVIEVDEEIAALIDAVAAQRRVTRAEAVRIAIKSYLGKGQDSP